MLIKMHGGAISENYSEALDTWLSWLERCVHIAEVTGFPPEVGYIHGGGIPPRCYKNSWRDELLKLREVLGT